jgi:hypothetical protein
MFLSSSCYSSSCTFWSKTCICSTRHVRHTFLIFEQIHIFLSSARTVSSNRDFGVEQFFRADEFRADDPSPLFRYSFASSLVCYKHRTTPNTSVYKCFMKVYEYQQCKLWGKNLKRATIKIINNKKVYSKQATMRKVTKKVTNGYFHPWLFS